MYTFTLNFHKSPLFGILNSDAIQLLDLSNEKVFEVIFKDHYNQLVHFALRYVSDDEVAEELVQETFSNIWIKAESIKVKTSLKSYLFGAIRNACLNYLKHEKVKQAYAANELFTSYEADEFDFLELDELKERIDKAFKKIPEKCRSIFEMSRYEGKKYQEIAEELSLSIKTIENQMGKALKILREELKDYLIMILWFMMDGGKF